MTKEAEELLAVRERELRAGGYLLNPDKEDTMTLMEGLVTNTRRYGYPSCPCRIAEGSLELDRDLICPCDYRDADLNDWGACYCALYVTQDWADGKLERRVVPERRPPAEARPKLRIEEKRHGQELVALTLKGRLPVWRCKVCGYLCAREKPPDPCPICRARADRFARWA